MTIQRFEDILMMHTIQRHINEVGTSALDVQNNLKRKMIGSNNTK